MVNCCAQRMRAADPANDHGKRDFQTAWVVMAPALWFDDHVLLG
jgi:hypothetical protein